MTAILIDPRTQLVRTVEPPAHVTGVEVAGIGLLVSDPMSVMTPGIRPFYFEPTGLMLGPVLIVDPVVPIHVVQRMTTWLAALMVINQATLIIPRSS
jgi:hypothetical protein